ncbi:uncharacterized protein LOC129589226 isoform X1 [Paramacrobiotus metropolitanus]|uniref:uncharacterized protein LOC129589226 isoform X1 n=1 Tax=Paramacrobiotus metropolitanus TaxID=2943436 RepID=UPI0024462B18|nr:uncharacterized protein LOC129589226 isoform X1 [Paramacrobiotus metropolitanus]XP_055339813.1 uncharacterized protein LOC129589226 isoform X1 [Paramacrobiotus metropolitanus]XP_055339823.1 uncharacterized protein LOC129589226 isoform X1 [Paramacrobiotus metropolitanus]
MKSICVLRSVHRRNISCKIRDSGRIRTECGGRRQFSSGNVLSQTVASVALESTVITHGMPFPENLRTAKSLENIVRQEGAQPATIAILDGSIKIGLDAIDLERLAQVKDAKKVSRRDLSFIVANKLHGGTTVSATMLLAHQAGIPIFATGGIGGVHRGGQNSMDVSADLTELGRTPVAVVCAGVKSILDVGRTLEYLETQGVCVATIGPSSDFPSFFSRKSGYFSPCHVRTEMEAAELIRSHQKLSLHSGILLAVPVPEENEIPLEKVEEWIYLALLECSSQKVIGKDITPFLLKYLLKISEGKTLSTNIALLENNARVAARIAVCLKRLKEKKSDSFAGYSVHGSIKETPKAGQFLPAKDNSRIIFSEKSVPTKAKGRPVVIGGSVLDIIAKGSSELKMNGSTHGGDINFSSGGVGRNVADCLGRLGVSAVFLSAVGDDYNGQFIKQSCSHMDLSHLMECPGNPTSCYIGILAPSGQLLGGLMNMSIHQMISPDYIHQHEECVQESPMLILDGNLSLEALDCALEMAAKYRVPVFYEPTDINKATKAFLTSHWKEIAFLSPNIKELQKIMAHFDIDRGLHPTAAGPHSLSIAEESFQRLFDQLPQLRVLLVKFGKQGSWVVSRSPPDQPVNCDSPNVTRALHFRHYTAPPVTSSQLVSVSGGGDCMVSGLISGILSGYNLDQAVIIGTAAAALSLKSDVSVPRSISSDILFSAHSTPDYSH